MGCASSKGFHFHTGKGECNFRRISLHKRKHCHHFVALTSTTYGFLNWDSPDDESDENYLLINKGTCTTDCEEGMSKQVNNKPILEATDTEESCVLFQLAPADEISDASFASNCADIAEVCSKPEVINIWELMEGLEDDCLNDPQQASCDGAKKTYSRSLSLSAMQAVKKLDSIFARDGISPSALDKLLKEIYCYYVSRRGKGCSRSRKGGKENGSPNKLKGENWHSVVSKKGGSIATPQRQTLSSKIGNIFCREASDVKPLMPLRNIENHCPKSPITPGGLKNPGNKLKHFVADSPSARQKLCTPSPRKSCYVYNRGFCTPKKGSTPPNREARSPVFDPDLLASIEKAFKQVTVEDWNARTCFDLSTSTSWSTSNEGTPLMSRQTRSDKHFLAGAGSAMKGNKIYDTGFWENLWSFKDGFSDRNNAPAAAAAAAGAYAASGGTAKKISFSKVSPIDSEAKKLIHNNPLDCFEWRCPPGGENLVVFYTTSLQGIRKTFNDCNNMHLILRSFRVAVDERDVSMHSDFRQEVKDLLGISLPVPRLFIKGRYIGGSEEVAKLHEEGKLVKLLDGIPKEDPFKICDGCGGLRFIPCLECSGSCKLVSEGGVVSRCPDCNENGLIRCPICC